MITTVNPCVVVKDGVCDFGPRYIFAVSRHNTLKHGGFGHRLFFTEKFVCSCMVSFVMTTSSLLLCALLHTMLCCSLPYALAHFRSSSVLSSTIFPCRTSDVVRTSDDPNPKPAQYLRTSVIFRTSDILTAHSARFPVSLVSDVRPLSDVRHIGTSDVRTTSDVRNLAAYKV